MDSNVTRQEVASNSFMSPSLISLQDKGCSKEPRSFGTITFNFYLKNTKSVIHKDFVSFLLWVRLKTECRIWVSVSALLLNDWVTLSLSLHLIFSIYQEEYYLPYLYYRAIVGLQNTNDQRKCSSKTITQM